MLRAALVLRRLPAEWCEWDVGAPETPASYRGYGSPTILIDGENVAGLPPGEGRQCVAAGAPALTQLLRALDRSLSLVGP